MKLLPGLLIGLALASGAAAEPAAPPPGGTPAPDADRADATAGPASERMRAAERRLAAAHERLEAAAREIAELSASLVGRDGALDIHVGGGPRAMLGLQLGEARAGGGVKVEQVSPGGAAGDAGVKSGDVLISVNGKRVRAAPDVQEQLHGLAPGSVAVLEVERAGTGKSERLNVTTRAFDPRFELLFDADTAFADLDHLPQVRQLFGGDPQSLLSGVGGFGDLELAPLSKDLGRYFGADKGVLVVRAPRDPVWQLKDGDVLSAIDGRDPQSVQHALRILGSYQAGERLTLAVLRERKPIRIELTMPAHAAHHMHPMRPPAPPAPLAPLAPPAPPAPPAPSAPAATGT